MRRRSLIVLASLVVLIGVGGYLFLRPDAITPENCRRIQPGMTEKDISALLGTEPHTVSLKSLLRIKSPRDPVAFPFDEAIFELTRPGQTKDWRGKYGTIRVYFSPPNRAVSSLYLRDTDGLFQRVRSCLGFSSASDTIIPVDLSPSTEVEYYAL
jgi:hypothetical protein